MSNVLKSVFDKSLDLTFCASIIAVHGLGGHAFRTWASQDQFMWLRDALPRQIPDARVMTYGYNSALFDSQTVANIRDFAKRLRILIDDTRTEKVRPESVYGESGALVDFGIGKRTTDNVYLS